MLGVLLNARDVFSLKVLSISCVQENIFLSIQLVFKFIVTDRLLPTKALLHSKLVGALKATFLRCLEEIAIRPPIVNLILMVLLFVTFLCT